MAAPDQLRQEANDLRKQADAKEQEAKQLEGQDTRVHGRRSKAIRCTTPRVNSPCGAAGANDERRRAAAGG